MKCKVCNDKNEAITWNYYAYGKDKNGNQQYICQYCLEEGARNIFRALIKERKKARNK